MPKRPGVSLQRIVAYCDRLCPPNLMPDWEGACNGLQLENRGVVHHLAAVVDARRATLERAAAAGADFVLAHHGLFWNETTPWTGSTYQLLRFVLEQDVAVYSLHLPLDEHPRMGNNVLLCRALGLRRLSPFLTTKGRKIGFQASSAIRRETLVQRLAKATGSQPHLIPAGPAQCRRIGVVTGGAGAELREAAAEGVDTFITGEGPHWTHTLAEDLGINVLYGGHYATETFGVKALTARISEQFKLPWSFIDYPTGL